MLSTGTWVHVLVYLLLLPLCCVTYVYIRILPLSGLSFTTGTQIQVRTDRHVQLRGTYVQVCTDQEVQLRTGSTSTRRSTKYGYDDKIADTVANFL